MDATGGRLICHNNTDPGFFFLSLNSLVNHEHILSISFSNGNYETQGMATKILHKLLNGCWLCGGHGGQRANITCPQAPHSHLGEGKQFNCYGVVRVGCSSGGLCRGSWMELRLAEKVLVDGKRRINSPGKMVLRCRSMFCVDRALIMTRGQRQRRG